MKWHKCQSIGLKPVVFGLKTNFELQTEEAREGWHQRTPQKRNPLDHKEPRDFQVSKEASTLDGESYSWILDPNKQLPGYEPEAFSRPAKSLARDRSRERGSIIVRYD